MTEVLGKLSCLDIPDFNGENLIYSDGGIVSLQMDSTANRPLAGAGGRLYIDTTLNKFFRDDGTSWIDLTSPADIQGTANQISASLTGSTTTLSLASNPIIPGVQRIKIPAGATADRPATPSAGDHRFNSEIGQPEMFNATDWLPYGNVLQYVSAEMAAVSGTATIPLDSTAPQITEGFQILNTTFTPLSSTSKIRIIANLQVSNSTAGRTIIAAVFVNGAASAVETFAIYSNAANTGWVLPVNVLLNSTNKTPKTITIRIGANGSGTTYFGTIGTNTLGGTINKSYSITEFI